MLAALSLYGPGRNGSVPFYLLYNLGKLSTYSGIGLLVGWLGSLMAYTESFDHFTRWLLLGSDLFIIVLGLGTAGAFRRLNFMQLEFAGPSRLMTGAVSRLHRLSAILSALPLGLL